MSTHKWRILHCIMLAIAWATPSWHTRVSVVLVTSPSPSNPCIAMVRSVLDSLVFLGLNPSTVPLHIVCDGVKTRTSFRNDNPWAMAKLGVVSPESACLYEKYIRCLEEEFGCVAVLRLSEHAGFAMAVREGLQRCETEYCLILQHDRVFCRPITPMSALLHSMDTHQSIRYVGFTSFKSAQHDKVLREKYNLLETLTPLVLSVDLTHSLLPCVFWYDSNHIAHVQRYLHIYSPFTHAPPEVFDHFGMRGVKDMLLKRGDFIEDKFGQAQRNMLVSLKSNVTAVQRLAQWFGCYLLWPEVSEHDWGCRVSVRHLRGRSMRPRAYIPPDIDS